jgi:hypothetical protein
MGGGASDSRNKQYLTPFNLWGLEYIKALPPAPGAASRDPRLAELLRTYGEPDGVNTRIVLPPGGAPEWVDEYLLRVDGLNIEYVIGNEMIPYSGPANEQIEPYANIILHHTDSGRSFDSYVRRSHELGNEYRGYHFYIDVDGSIVQAAPLTVRVNGVGGFQGDVFRNSNSIHISLYGDGRHHTPEQVAAMTRLVEALQEDFGIAADRVTTHGFIQDNRPAEQENPALVEVMRNVGAPIPLLSTNDGRTYSGQPDPNERVGLLQRFLSLNRDDPAGTPPYAIDGIYGGMTQAQVAAFQQGHGLTVTGYIDGPTFRLMARMALGPDLRP